jgi:type IX secretion system substrate protein
MKKLFTVIPLFLLIAVLSIQAGDRLVLVERFTSSTCPPCASNNPIMDAFLSSVDADRIIGMSYHMNWPAPGNDPMFLYNQGDNTARRTFYGINSIPEARMDGLITVLPPYNSAALQSYFDSRKNILTPLTVVVTETPVGDSIRITATIYCEVMLVNPNVTLHVAVQEKHIHYASPPGTNGETDFYDVMRKMPPNGNGVTVTLYPGQTQVAERTVYRDPLWQVSETRPVVYLQSGNEIIAAAQKTNNFTLLPITGYKSVAQGQNQSATYQMSVPVVAAGYTSPVTLTAQVSPPNAGVTVTFPGGNVISSFPSNFNVQVNSTSSVPTGDYRIIVTGTNGNGKVHSTSVSYLVGRNFVNVSSSNGQLTYAVDGVIYGTLKLFSWDLGSQHTLSAVSPQTFGSTRYVYQSWSDNGDSSHQITVSTNSTSYWVNYKTQFKLLPLLTPPGIPVTVVGGNIFYDSAATVSFTVNPGQVQFNGKMYYFQNWVGQGPGSYSGTLINPQITMLGVVVERAVFDTIVPFGINNLNTGVPKEYALHQNYPNPFNPVTKIRFDLPKHSDVKLVVYDLLGSEVTTLVNGTLEPGYYETELDASVYASGVYIYRLEAGNYSSVRRMILVK